MNTDPEPSMEDILASIRKIIADDESADGVDLSALQDDSETAPVMPSPEDSAIGVQQSDASFSETEGFDETSASLDIEAFLTDFDAVDEGTPVASEELAVPAPEVEAVSAPVDPQANVSETVLEESEDDMDLLMDELMAGLADEVVSTPVGTEAEMADEPVTEAVASEPVPTEPVSADDDMDIVKSLMEDLTDDDLVMEGVEPMDDMSIPAEPEAPAEPLEADIAPEPEDELDLMEDDILASLTDMALADEDVPSLTDIAAAAEADAAPQAVELAPAQTDEELVARAEAEPAPESEPEPTYPDQPVETPSMETPMPRAVRSDAILDDVTEEATMSAFAQLNQVVEDKAILSERGPRIGDLVQEALKPMLKEWLDENLQGIVERAVQKEVKRIASGK